MNRDGLDPQSAPAPRGRFAEPSGAQVATPLTREAGAQVEEHSNLLTTCMMLGDLRRLQHLDAVNVQGDRKSADGWGDSNEYLLEAEDCIGYSSRALFSFRAIFIRSMGSVSYPLGVRSVPNNANY